MAYAVYGTCTSLNKLAFTSLWLTLEFFPMQSQGPSPGGLRDSPETWDMTILLRPIFPTTLSWNKLGIFFFFHTRNLQTVSVKGQAAYILGFSGHILCHTFFFNHLQPEQFWTWATVYQSLFYTIKYLGYWSTD